MSETSQSRRVGARSAVDGGEESSREEQDATVTFEEFARARLQALLRFATALTTDRALGEDLVQDVMLRVHARWSQISELDEPFMYVRRMLVNEFVSWRRKWARIVPRSDVAELDTQASPDPASGQAERAALAADIARLPRRQRAVIVLRYYEDLPDDEIAKLLGCSVSTVRVHALRGLRALRVELGMAARPAPARENP